MLRLQLGQAQDLGPTMKTSMAFWPPQALSLLPHLLNSTARSPTCGNGWIEAAGQSPKGLALAMGLEKETGCRHTDVPAPPMGGCVAELRGCLQEWRGKEGRDSGD